MKKEGVYFMTVNIQLVIFYVFIQLDNNYSIALIKKDDTNC